MPVIQLSLGSKTLSQQEISDLGNNFIRTQLVTVQGAAVPVPYGGKSRVVNVDLDPDALYARGISPQEVTNAILAQNIIVSAGTVKMGPIEYDVAMNSSPEVLADLNNIPLRYVNGAMVYMRDVAFVHDGYSPQTNLVRTGRAAVGVAADPDQRQRIDAVGGEGRSATDAQNPGRPAQEPECATSCSIRASSSAPRLPEWSAKA